MRLNLTDDDGVLIDFWTSNDDPDVFAVLTKEVASVTAAKIAVELCAPKEPHRCNHPGAGHAFDFDGGCAECGVRG